MKAKFEEVKLSINKNHYKKYISEENYINNMEKEVEPYLKNMVQYWTIKGKNNVRLYYEKYIMENSKGNIVISHGFGEFIDKYYELIYYFLKENYSVFIIEHRGNSRSQRLGKDKSQISVEKFDYYLEDFKEFIDKIVIPSSNNKKLLLFGHSMGGGIGTLFLEKYPKYFNGAVFSSPMYEINSGKTPKYVAMLIAILMNLLGKGKEYIPGQSHYTGERRFPSRSTSSLSRYDYQYYKIKENHVYQTGGASAKWYLESIIATKKLRMKKNAVNIKIPILLIQGGRDTHVLPEAHYKVASYVENFKIIRIEESKHESYCESDNIAFPVIDTIIKFYNNIN